MSSWSKVCLPRVSSEHYTYFKILIDSQYDSGLSEATQASGAPQLQQATTPDLVKKTHIGTHYTRAETQHTESLAGFQPTIHAIERSLPPPYMLYSDPYIPGPTVAPSPTERYRLLICNARPARFSYMRRATEKAAHFRDL